jgi:glycosyltransferase involved in cell wall biosynthesis
MSSFNESNVVFVADLFLEEYGGGAERSTEALFETSPYKTFKLKSSSLTKELIQNGTAKFWVFFNYRGMNHNLIPDIVRNLNYAIVEYDYKFCQYRSMDLHKRETGEDCNCADKDIGKIISAFLHGSDIIYWMSQNQAKIYHEKFPFLKDHDQLVLSSIFSVKDLEFMNSLRHVRKPNNKWAVIDGNSWIKGVVESKKVVTDYLNSEAEILSGLAYYDLLRKLSEFKGLSFHPLGADTCPRTTIEAKMMGLELSVGQNVQHFYEDWFQGDEDVLESYLLSRHEAFWAPIINHFQKPITVSGYTTTKNVIESEYPWRESVTSLLGFCDEVVVVDGGSDDGTWEELVEWSQKESKLKIKQIKRDWSSERFALFDFQQKAEARKLCTSDWCWQMDIDEIVHEDDYDKVRGLIRNLPKNSKVVCLPVIDFWGNNDKVRLDVHPWKWRLSKNDPEITHDIPKPHRAFDEQGRLYSLGSDGCDYVHKDTFEYIPNINFYTSKVDAFRQHLLNNEDFRNDNLTTYVKFINENMKNLPSVYHYSWFDIKRKIHNYRDFWSKFHASLYNRKVEDNAENNKFFNKPWSEVSEKEIVNMAEKLNNEMGGWIFHSRVDFSRPTPWYFIEKDHPLVIKDWLEKRRQK